MAQRHRLHLPGSIETRIAGEEIVLMPQRAAFWPAAETLLIADVHLGKGNAARAEGSPVSESVLAAMLRKQLEPLTAAVRSCSAKRLLILGDLLHAPIGITDSLLDAVAQWRAQIDASIAVIPGNHDRKLKKAAERWGMDVLDEHITQGPFEFTHIPREPASASFLWCGHLHPAISLARGGDALKLPAFHLTSTIGVLPAFTPFAAGKQLRVCRGDRLYAIAQGKLVDFSLCEPTDEGSPR